MAESPLRARVARRAAVARDHLDAATERARTTEGPAGLALAYYERDREVHASVIGSAIALRLFLFMIPCILTVVGLTNLLRVDEVIGELLDSAEAESSVADDIIQATTTSGRGGLGLLLSGIVLVLWSGRALAVVLAACSASAWRLPASEARPRVRVLVGLVGLLFAIVVGTVLAGRVRALGGLALTSASIVATLALYTVAWFTISVILPRATNDPGAHLPGAALVGVGLTALQLTLSLWIPQRLESASETMGSLAVSVVSLGYLFFVGRLTSFGFVVNAVTYERVGSLSELVFGLPLLRALPRRSARLARFFDLEVSRSQDGDG